MSENIKKPKKKKAPKAIKESLDWGEESGNNFGYATEQDRKDKRGLEDWEMVTSMEKSEVGIPYWFLALFLVLLIVAVGLTLPFWGNRPGYERPWFDWGIPLGVAWCVGMSVIIYYFVDLRYILHKKKEQKKMLAEEKAKNDNEV